MVRRFEADDLGEVGVKTAVLLVLRAVHAGVIGRDDDQAAIGAGQGRAHKRVGGDVEANVLHRDQSAFPGKRDAQGFFKSDLLVDRPGGDESLGFGRGLDQVFHDLGGGSPGIGVAGAQTGMDGAQGDGFIAE
jgi:hypothetical protein